LLTVDDGRMMELTIQDAYLVDNWSNKPYKEPPQALIDLMGLELFLFRDANFWPDFPTSAAVALDLYAYGQDVPTPDGMIAVDQGFIQLILDSIGPVQVPGAEVSITSDNVRDSFRESWAFQGDPNNPNLREWLAGRKEFVGTFTAAVLSKIESDPMSIDYGKLARSLRDAVEAKHLQIFVRDPATASVLSELGWDGALPYDEGIDHLAIIDTNVGYSKSNPLVQRVISYHVELDRSGVSSAHLSVNYEHTGKDDGEVCLQDISYAVSIVTDYMNLVRRCYWNYLRVYTPAGSRLVSSSQHDVPTDSLVSGTGWQGPGRLVTDLGRLTTFANFLMVPRGRSVTSTYEYLLPPTTVQASADHFLYELSIFKQAGVPPEELMVTVTLPHDARLIDASPLPADITGADVSFRLVLRTDMSIAVRFR
jgi:hypothetical protein